MTQPGGNNDPTEWIEEVDPPTEYFEPLDHNTVYGGSERFVGGGSYDYEGYEESYTPPPKQGNALYILVFSLVLILGLLLGVSGYFLYAGFPNQHTEAGETSDIGQTSDAGATPGAEETSGEEESSGAEESSEAGEASTSDEAEEAEEVNQATGRPLHVDLPADAEPANLFARNGQQQNGQLFNVYASGPVNELLAVLVQGEYRVKYPGFHPPKGEHYITVNDSQSGELQFTCRDNGSYVRCVSGAGHVVYLV